MLASAAYSDVGQAHLVGLCGWWLLHASYVICDLVALTYASNSDVGQAHLVVLGGLLLA